MPRRSILEYLENFKRADIAYVHRRGYRTYRRSYEEIFEHAAQFARELEARQVGKGDHVLLWGENSAEWVAVFWGCLLRGAVIVPMDRTAAPDFVRRAAGQVAPKLAVCSRELAAALPSIPILQLENLVETINRHATAAYPHPEVQRSDVVEIVFTSGATADPKGVVITHGNILANLETFEPEIRKYLKYERIFHPIRFLNLLPLSHVFGQFLAILIPQLIAGEVHFQETLNPAEIMRTIKTERISVLVAVPRILHSLKEKIERDFELAGRKQWLEERLQHAAQEHFVRRWWSFRRIHNRLGWKFWALVSGGATLDAETEEFWRRLAFAVLQGYGLTETTSLISVNHPFRLGRGSIGKVLPGREIKLDPSGEILVRGENVAAGYWQGRNLQPIANTEAEGWFRTGDLGEIDSQGYLHFKGRKKQVIVSAEGMNIYPEDLEAALRTQPEVRDAVVVGMERNGNAEPCAVLLLRGSGMGTNDADAAIRRANASLAPHQQIRRWFLWPEPDFPRTSTQKVRSNVVREVAQQQIASQDGSPSSSASTTAESPLAEIIARITRRPPQALAQETALEDDLNLSSLDRVELMSALEDRYQVELHDKTFSEVKTIADLEHALRATQSQPEAERKSGYEYPRWAGRWPLTWIRRAVYYLAVWPATMLLAAPRVVGREHLKNFSGPALVVSNHITYIDIGFVLAALPARLRHHLATAMGGERLMNMRRPPGEWFFLRRWLYRIGYFLAVALFNVFPLPQRSGFRESFAFAGCLVDEGASVLIFPEGERTPDGKIHTFRSGAGLLAARLNVPVIPMRIDGLWELKRAGKQFALPGTIRITIGEPIKFDPAMEPEEIVRELQTKVELLAPSH
jgi:long-chain acyl-CoA synthetase